jgi:hypothetical protein
MVHQSIPLYDEMLALVEGRHTTSENVFHITQMTPGDAKSDDKDECNIHSITCYNSFETSSDDLGSAKQSFSDWVCSHL